MAEEDIAQPENSEEETPEAPENSEEETPATPEASEKEHIVTQEEQAEGLRKVQAIEDEIAEAEEHVKTLRKKYSKALESVPRVREATEQEQREAFRKNFLRLPGASARVPVTRAPSNVRTGSFS